MKILVTILIAIVSTSSFGILINMSEEAKKECMEDFGGYLPDTRKQKGDLAIINTQNRAHDAWIRFGGNLFANDIFIPVKYECGKFDIKSPELKGTLNLFIIDDKTMPLSLLAPEAKWAVLNIEKLYSDKTAFFEARVKKAVYRVIGELCGASATKYNNCIFGPMASAEDLDQIPAVRLPLEYHERFAKYLPGIGITPYRMVRYDKAVEQGWAHSPTNKWQQAVWDKVHQLPTEPIKIKPETKKVTE